MPINAANLDAAIAAMLAQATETETVEASAIVALKSQSDAIAAAVTAALEKDSAANSETIRVATEAISAVTAKFAASEDKLGVALVANTPSAPPADTPVAPV